VVAVTEHAPADPWPARLSVAILGLGVTQIIAWGSIYYSLAVLGPSITRDLGWDAQWTYVGFSLALVVAGLGAPLAGRAIDHIGGRPVMTAGSAVAALGLALLAASVNWWSYLAGWGILGIAKSMVLYEAAFATLAQISIKRARRAITYLSFFGGLASTVFWPLTRLLHEGAGWRNTLLIYAVLAAVVCLPIHWLALPSLSVGMPKIDRTSEASPGSDPIAPSHNMTLAATLLSGSFASTAFMWSGISVHILSILGLLGLSSAAAVAIGAMIGPSQVLGRVGDMLYGSRFHPLNVLQVSSTLLPIAFGILGLAQGAPWAAVLFAVLYGTSIGMNTIARGAVPLALFGPHGYGARLGRIAAPSFIAEALAPVVYAYAVSRQGPWGGLILAAGAAVVAWIGVFGLSVVWRRRAESKGGVVSASPE
jgi:MFS family permease